MLVRQDATSASAVRHELALDLDLHGVDEMTIADLVLVASELVGNAVRHAGTDGGLDINWTIGPDDVVLSVEDPSDDPPVPRCAARDAASGRGLAIVAAVASEWGYEPTVRGKRVWAKVSLPTAS